VIIIQFFYNRHIMINYNFYLYEWNLIFYKERKRHFYLLSFQFMTRRIHTKTNKMRVCVWHIRTRVGRYRHVSILTPWWTLRVQLPERRKFWLEHRDPSKEFFCPFSSVTKQILEKLLKNPILLSFRLHVYVKQIIPYSLTRIIIYANQLFFILC